MDSLYATPPVMEPPRADRGLKIALKVVKEDFRNTYSKSYSLHLPFFHDFFTVREVVPPPRCQQALNLDDTVIFTKNWIHDPSFSRFASDVFIEVS